MFISRNNEFFKVELVRDLTKPNNRLRCSIHLEYASAGCPDISRPSKGRLKSQSSRNQSNNENNDSIVDVILDPGSYSA